MSNITEWIDEQVLERLRLHGLTFVLDALVVVASYVLAEYLRFYPKTIPLVSLHSLLISLPVLAAVYVFFNWLFGVHRRLWQYAGIPDVRSVVDSAVLATLLVAVADFVIGALNLWSSGVKLEGRPIPLSSVVIGGGFSLAGFLFVRLWPRLFRRKTQASEGWARVLIVGAGQAGQLVAADLIGNPQWRQLPVGFVDDDLSKRRRRIHNVPVLGPVDSLPGLVATRQIDIVGVAIPSASTKELDRILAIAQQTPARIQVLPSRGDMMVSRAPLRLRDINLGDLLNRVPARSESQSDRVESTIQDRVVLVTGAAGSIGSELCRQIMQLSPAGLIAVDNNETGLFHLEHDLAKLAESSRVLPVLGDITDLGKMGHLFRTNKPDIVFHAAAYKHVPMLERYPEESVFINVQGTANLCRLAADARCDRFVFISTDKAVHPVNALGYSKRIGELITRAHQGKGPVYCSVRFGNVVGSRGSALPEFIRQIDKGGPVMVTHPDVERYFMTIPEAVSLVIQAGALAQGGEVFMLDMGEPIKIADLAKRIIRVRGLRVGSDIEIMYTGLRPGEKLTEDLVFQGERTRPTEDPSIVSVEDDVHPDLTDLDGQIAALVNLAAQGDAEQVRQSLAMVSRGEQVPALTRLGSVG